MPLFENHERNDLGKAQPALEFGPFAPIRWREPCLKIAVIANLFFVAVAFASIGLTAALKPSVQLAESNAFQITGQIKFPCIVGQRILLYGFDFFTIIRNTFVINGSICRDITAGKWAWQFADPKFSNYNSN